MKQVKIKQLIENDYFVQTELDRLRVNVGFTGVDKKVIMISSSRPNEGKSFVATGLWLELAKAGKQVCFIDADMRNSYMRSNLRMKFSESDNGFVGLSHYLAGANMDDIIYQSNIENAYIIPTTNIENPSLLLEGDRFKTLLSYLRTQFDYIIIDTPPLELISDGQRIANICDGCILVVQAHVTSRSDVQKVISMLEVTGCTLLGVVLNQQEDKKIGKYRKYSSKEYKYYYGS
jgi:capsular exopolysaccharide synthesis family protein